MDNALSLTPIEERFFKAARGKINGLVPQVWIGNYRVDFYIPSKKLIIELDGHDYHSTKEQRERDAIRDRNLKLLGFDLIRFTGREIYRNVHKCVGETIKYGDTRPNVPVSDTTLRDLEESNPDLFFNQTYYCSYMQKVINKIFIKHGLKNSEGSYIRLRVPDCDDLSIGVIEDGKVYVAYTYSVNGDRALDPEIILYRYFDSTTNLYEMIPFSYEISTEYRHLYDEYLEFNEYGKFEIINKDDLLLAANYIEGMARRIEFFGFLENPEVIDFNLGEIED